MFYDADRKHNCRHVVGHQYASYATSNDHGLCQMYPWKLSDHPMRVDRDKHLWQVSALIWVLPADRESRRVDVDGWDDMIDKVIRCRGRICSYWILIAGAGQGLTEGQWDSQSIDRIPVSVDQGVWQSRQQEKQIQRSWIIHGHSRQVLSRLNCKMTLRIREERAGEMVGYPAHFDKLPLDVVRREFLLRWRDWKDETGYRE